MTLRDSHIPRHLRVHPWRDRWRVVRLIANLVYFVATALVLRETGIPVDREIIIVWLVGLASISTLGRTRREIGVLLLSWAPFLLALYLYDFARGAGYWLYERNIGFDLSVTPQLDVDRVLGGGRLWTERLQEWLVADLATLRANMKGCNDGRFFRPSSAVRWYDVVVSAVYTSHFVVPYLAAGYFWRKGQRLWRWYAATFVFVSALACLVFAVAPTAPPWYAACEGLIGRFPRGLANDGWSEVGLSFASRAIRKGAQTFNPYAAIPSLHTANAVLVSVFAWRFVHRRLRAVVWPILVLYPLGMGFALVYSGEHYVIDIIAGGGVVALALTLGWWLRQRRGWASPWRDGPQLSGPESPLALPEAPTAAGDSHEGV